MRTLKQHFLGDNGLEEYYVIHIYSENGFFTTDISGHELACGWHIQLGTNDSVENYKEHEGTEDHFIPEELPDVVYHVFTDEELAELDSENEREVLF